MTITATSPLVTTPVRVSTGRLYVMDVWRIWCQEQTRRGLPPITPRAVYNAISLSRPAAAGQPPRRYQDDPMPLPEYEYPDPARPRYGPRAYWRPRDGETVADLEDRLRRWWITRPYFGRQKTPPALRLCRCGSGIRVATKATCGRCRYDLTRRERRVCAELVTGGAYKEIAERLGMTPGSVKRHVSAAYRKVGARSRAELVQALLSE